jgi:hypothetical protein
MATIVTMTLEQIEARINELTVEIDFLSEFATGGEYYSATPEGLNLELSIMGSKRIAERDALNRARTEFLSTAKIEVTY